MQQKTINYIDAHAHLNFTAYDNDREEVIARMCEEGVAAINVGTQRDTSAGAVALAEKYENLYAIVGLHPVHTGKSFHDTAELGEGGKEFVSRGEVFDTDYYRELAVHPRVVGIGECGLDYFHLEEDTKERQCKAFVAQLTLARELGKPVMLHIREAYDDALAVLNDFPDVVCNVHFFAGTKEHARHFLERGCTLSFTGVITFAKEYEELVAYVPLDRILSETDCPFVTPKPHRGKRNEPTFVMHVVQRIAEIKGVAVDEVAARIRENSTRVFGI